LAKFDSSTIYHEDIKLSQLEAQTGFPLELTYTLLLIADEIGEQLFFTNNVVDKKSAFQDDCTLFFLTKMIAMCYDEVFDTLWRFRNGKDYKNSKTSLFDSQLQTFGIVPQKEELRDFGRKLRNSIHYKNCSWVPHVEGHQVNHIPAFLDIVGAKKWPQDYLSAYHEMEEQLNKLYAYLMEFFNIEGVHVNI
jgi:hypothetical protein